MAPTQGKKRTSLRAKASSSKLPLSDSQSKPLSDPTPSHFPSTKRDKLSTKHSSFVSKIEKTSSKSTKPRRPNKQLVANLESLTDALPEVDCDSEVVVGQAKVQRKSLKSMKSRPGATKKREKLERMERERFNANLVQMSTGAGIADRWAALKNHVKNTVEQKAEFAPKAAAKQ